MYICVCVCVYIYTYIHIYIYTYIYTHIYVCVRARVCIHTQPIVMRYKSYIRRWRLQYISRVGYLGECKKKICQPQKCVKDVYLWGGGMCLCGSKGTKALGFSKQTCSGLTLDPRSPSQKKQYWDVTYSSYWGLKVNHLTTQSPLHVKTLGTPLFQTV